MKKRLGIHIAPDKSYLLESKFAKLLKAGDRNADDIIEDLKRGSEDTELTLAQFITTGHTYFFRESEHLDYLIADIKKRGIARPRIWCAASSTGEEAYSIAIAMMEAGISDYLLLASDVNIQALQTCRLGLYRESSLRALSPTLRQRYFQKADAFWRVNFDLIKRPVLKRLNLLHSLKFEDSFHYVFCRNVFIYFDNQTQRQAVETILDNLAEGGRLFVGLSEALLHLADRLVSVAPSIYARKR